MSWAPTVTQVTELGVEKRCPKCGEYLPADAEFWHRNSASKDGLYSYCKACCYDRHHKRWLSKVKERNSK